MYGLCYDNILSISVHIHIRLKRIRQQPRRHQNLQEYDNSNPNHGPRPDFR
jgi:hypothetical protein